MILVYELGTATGITFARNQRFLQKIIDGDMVGVVSTFTLAECITVLAVGYAQRDGKAPSAEQLQEVGTRVEKFIRAAGIELQDADKLSRSEEGDADLFSRVMQTASSTFPVKSSRPGRNGKPDWRTTGGADILHIVFAERSGCHELATHDEGFRSMKSTVSLNLLRGT